MAKGALKVAGGSSKPKSPPKELAPLLDANMAELEKALESGRQPTVISGKTSVARGWQHIAKEGDKVTGIYRGAVRAGMKLFHQFATRNGNVEVSGGRDLAAALKNGGGAGKFFQLTFNGFHPDSVNAKGRPRKGSPNITVAVI